MLTSSMAPALSLTKVGQRNPGCWNFYRSLDSEKRAKWAVTMAFLAWLVPEDSEAIMKSDMRCGFECDDWWSLGSCGIQNKDAIKDCMTPPAEENDRTYIESSTMIYLVVSIHLT